MHAHLFFGFKYCSFRTGMSLWCRWTFCPQISGFGFWLSLVAHVATKHCLLKRKEGYRKTQPCTLILYWLCLSRACSKFRKSNAHPLVESKKPGQLGWNRFLLGYHRGWRGVRCKRRNPPVTVWSKPVPAVKLYKLGLRGFFFLLLPQECLNDFGF